MRRTPHVIGLVVAALLIAGCTLPTDDSAQVLTGPEIDNVMNPTTTSTTSAVETRDRELFLFDDDDLLAPSVVAVPHDADIAAILNLLAPSDDRSMRTAVPDGFVVSTTELSSSGVLTVVLADDTLFAQVGGDQLPQAVGQIVVTATELDDVDVRGVRFAIDGEPPQPRQVPTGDGVNTDGPVTRCDYRQFLPAPC